RKLKSMLQDEIIESDGDYYWKKSEKSVRIHTRYIPIALLIAIVILGFYLRIYHIDYPVIGYHNWKETRYLTIARNFAREGFFRYGFFVPAHDYPGLHSDPSGAHPSPFPILSIINSFLFQIFGFKLWIARLPGIIANTLTILVMYLLLKKLFKREEMALVGAFLTSLNPLFVFFSHNVQPENIGVLLMLTSAYFYIKWRENNSNYDLVIATILLTFAGLTRYPFLVIFLPMILTFPMERLKKFKENWKLFLLCIVIFLLFPIWFSYNEFILSKKLGRTAGVVKPGMINFGRMFESDFWPKIEPYLRDNYTMIGTYFAFFGLILLIFNFFKIFKRKRKDKNFGDKFLISYFIGFIVFLFIMAPKMTGHSYHQYPIAPFVIMLMTYFIVKISDFAKKLKVEGRGIHYINFIVILLFISLLFLPMRESAARQFDTQFYGLDVAGKYLKEHKQSGEQLIHSTHQAYGILWYADMKGTRGIPETVEDVKYAEEKRNASWLFIYYWDFPKVMKNNELWSYIRNNYELKQFAFIHTPDGNQPIYMLLKKGGTFDDSKLNTMLMGKPIMYKDYELTKGKVRLNYINV
ncbi:hypothetical protein DRN73_07755, partial [Candidatus Pacearchaeota archaeon]